MEGMQDWSECLFKFRSERPPFCCPVPVVNTTPFASAIVAQTCQMGCSDGHAHLLHVCTPLSFSFFLFFFLSFFFSFFLSFSLYPPLHSKGGLGLVPPAAVLPTCDACALRLQHGLPTYSPTQHLTHT